MISQQEFDQLEPGMHVRIVDQWNEHTIQNPSGLMDQYLGSIVTVVDHWAFNIDPVRRFMVIEEDGGRWAWNRHCIDCVVEPLLVEPLLEEDAPKDSPDFPVADESSILAFLTGGAL